MSRLWITGGRLLCPATGRDEVGALEIVDGEIVGVRDAAPAGEKQLDAAGAVVTPGFVDLHVDLGVPGAEFREGLAAGTAAAARGGFTTICLRPTAERPNDDPAVTAAILGQPARVRVRPVAALSVGLEGRRLSEMIRLAEAGAVAFGDRRDVADSALLRRGMEYALATGQPVFVTPEDARLAGKGVMHEGPVATRLGLPGVPAAAEEVAVARAVALVEETGAPAHVGPISTAGAVRLLRDAKGRGLPVTCSVGAPHLVLLDEAIADAYDPNLRVRPPLRDALHQDALIGGLREGVIDAVTALHVPCTVAEKALEFGLARPGMVGLETALGVLLQLVDKGLLDLKSAVRALTAGAVVGQRSALEPGARADVVVFDPDARTRVDRESLAGKAFNTPFLGQALPGRVRATVVDGQVVYREDA